jgi:dihydrofolate reductase
MIVAYGSERQIGMDGGLPWQSDLPADLRHFRELTTGNAIVMGRVTFTDDLQQRILPNRQMIVVSRQPVEYEGVTVVHSLDEAYAAVEPDREIFVIGGAQLYTQALGSVARIYATEIDATFAADRYFPNLDETWHEVSRESHQADEKNKFNYDFVIYERDQNNS